MFINLHSWFSFHYGTMSVETLLAEAQRVGVKKCALTDINNTSGILDFVRLAPKYNIEPVAGVEFRNASRLCFIALAANNDGFEEINRFLSACLKEGARLGKSSGNRDAIIPDRPPAFRNVWIIYPLEERPQTAPAEQQSALSLKRDPLLQKYSVSRKRYKKGTPSAVLRENEFIGVRPDQLTRLPFLLAPEELNRCLALWPVTMATPADHKLHHVLQAMGNNTLISKVDQATLAHDYECFVQESVLRQRYSEYPCLISNTESLLNNCRIAFDFHEPKNKQSFTGSRGIDLELLAHETWKGAAYRYGSNLSEESCTRIEKELRMIQEQGFAAYFLISWDIVRYAQRKNYFYVGRGSGANSIVAYCLRITDVDPIDLDLYFERFINPYRTSPPDFDLDFSWKDRDDVTDYIFRRHGEEHTALIATYSTYQSNAVVRELGKAFGLPPAEIDALQDTRNGEVVGDEMAKRIHGYGQRLHDFPQHLSIHAGGVLISEKPIVCYTALNHPPKGFPLTQFSMLEAEDVGLHKYDILSQRGLGHIRDTVDIVKHNTGTEIDIHRISDFKQDEKIKELIRDGKCMGCFYVESPAMRMLLKKLQVDQYLQLVAASSIIRPGVARSGMMREYILRTHDPSRRIYSHPVMKELMEETYGIMVYQEDVIKVAHHFAGLGLSEADVLRRGMSGKFRSREEFQKIKEKFFVGCQELGRSPETAAEVWRQIESFAGYSFSKGHSASYAVESYQSLYLKAHHPLEFMVGVINNFGGFYRTEFYVHEARMSGAEVHAPEINKSDYLTTIDGQHIYLGLVHLDSLEQETAFAILEERQRSGPYLSLTDFMHRVAIGLEQLRILVRIGAFRFTGRSKKELLWDLHLHLGAKKKTTVEQALFAEPENEWVLPKLHYTPLEDAFDEIELLGFPLCSPFELLKDKTQLHSLLASDFSAYRGREIEITGYLVTVKYTRTIKGEQMGFGCFIDVAGRFFDTTHFPAVFRDYPFRGRGLYNVRGKVETEFGFDSLTVRSMEKLHTVNLVE